MSAPIKAPFIAAALLAATSSTALAEYRWETSGGGSFQFYGQFDPAYLSFDDGVSTKDGIVDNTNSNSRVGIWFRQPTDNGEFAINLESSFGLRPSAGLTQGFTPEAADWRRRNIRKVEAIWKSDRYGTFFLGQGSMSSDSAANKDLSGTTLVLYNSIPDTAGAFRFRTSAGALTLKTIAQGFGSFDGGRKGRIRYDTPAYKGFKLSVSYGEEVLVKNVDEEVAAVGIHYAGQVGAYKLAGGLAYNHAEFASGLKRRDTVGSFSALHDSGWNVTVAAGDRRETGHYVYGKIGYQADWLAAGKTALAIDYYSGQDKTSAGSESDSVGIGVVQNFDRARVQAYLGYRQYSLNETGVTYRDASSVMFGARWQF